MTLRVVVPDVGEFCSALESIVVPVAVSQPSTYH